MFVRGADRPKWKLAFRIPPKFPIISGEEIRDANGDPLEVILVDADTGEPLLAPPDVLRIELVTLLGNFPRDNSGWNANDFQRGVVENLKRPLLVGHLRLTMWDGHATVDELMFVVDSRKHGCCMFRIGVRILPDSYDGACRILEGMTEAFMVRQRHRYEVHRSKGYKWQLAFQSQPRLPIHVGGQIRDAIGDPLEVILVDLETGLRTKALLSTMDQLHVQVVSLSAWCLDDDDWSANEFQRAVRKPGDQLYLSGDVRLTMKDDGQRTTVSELQYTDSRYLNYMGLCVVPGSYDGNGSGRILEGVTRVLGVKHSRREEMVTKPDVLCLGDEVWRLRCISWGGVFHKRLAQNNVRNVQDFLTMLAVKPDELRAVRSV